MSATKSSIPFTYEDYKSLAETSDKRYELIDGEIVMVPAPTLAHQIVAQNIEFLLMQHTRATDCGRVLHAPVDVVLGEGERRDVVQPDILFVDRARVHILERAEVVGAPDLVVEVLSPGTEKRDRSFKRAAYARAGVREYWIVDPESESIEVCSLGASDPAPVRYERGDVLEPAVVPGLRVVPLAEVFRRA